MPRRASFRGRRCRARCVDRRAAIGLDRSFDAAEYLLAVAVETSSGARNPVYSGCPPAAFVHRATAVPNRSYYQTGDDSVTFFSFARSGSDYGTAELWNASATPEQHSRYQREVTRTLPE